MSRASRRPSHISLSSSSISTPLLQLVYQDSHALSLGYMNARFQP